MELVLKGIAIAAASIGAGLLARRGHGSLAALMVSLPVFSLGALWVAASQGNEMLASLSFKTLCAIVVWIAYMTAVWLLAKYSGWNPSLCIAGGLVVWLVAALAYLKVSG